jgi:hypothetical protein
MRFKTVLAVALVVVLGAAAFGFSSARSSTTASSTVGWSREVDDEAAENLRRHCAAMLAVWATRRE